MAKVLSAAGGFVTDKSVQNHKRFMVTAFIGGCLITLMFGFWCGFQNWGPELSPWLSTLVPGALLIASFWIYRLVDRRMDCFDRARIAYLKGATGEDLVAQVLADFPNEFVVVNDLPTPHGNLDHVVIGPTGVFVIETKNWKGVVASNGQKDILLNGKSYDKAPIKILLGRVMNVRDQLMAHGITEPELPFFQALMVFPLAWIEVRWGMTGNVICLNDEQLHDFIVESRKATVLDRHQIEKLAEAFVKVATANRATERPPPSVNHSVSIRRKATYMVCRG